MNSILFLAFCLAGLYFLFNAGRMIGNPLVKKQKYFATGPQIFLIFSVVTGFFMLGEWSATRLSIWIVYLIVGTMVTKGKIKFTPVLILYIFYILYLFLSLFILSPDKFFGIRVIAKYLFPLCVLIFAAKIANSEFVIYSGIKYVLAIAIFIQITFFLWINWGGIFWVRSTLADHLVVMSVISLALFYATSKKKYLYLTLFFCSFPVVATIRTGLMGITGCFTIFFLFKYKWRALPVVVFVVAAAVLVVLYVPAVRGKMFRDKQMTADEIIENRENLTLKDIDTNGRQAMWDWSLDNYYRKNKVFGTGVGNLQMVFYSGKHPFNPLRVVHNDYVQILCDTGLVGLILFLLTSLSLVIHSFIIYNDKRNNEMIRLCAIVAGSSLVGILITSYTDNSVNYSFATYFYPYVFFGMALSLVQKYGR